MEGGVGGGCHIHCSWAAESEGKFAILMTIYRDKISSVFEVWEINIRT